MYIFIYLYLYLYSSTFPTCRPVRPARACCCAGVFGPIGDQGRAAEPRSVASYWDKPGILNSESYT